MCVKYIKGMHYDGGGLVLEMGDCCCVELTGGQWGYSKCLSTLHHSLDGKTREEHVVLKVPFPFCTTVQAGSTTLSAPLCPANLGPLIRNQVDRVDGWKSELAESS